MTIDVEEITYEIEKSGIAIAEMIWDYGEVKFSAKAAVYVL